jgi:hypothetical protein
VITLDQRGADALAGDWYRQYVAAREAEPGDALGWAVAVIDAEAVLEGGADLPEDVLMDVERFLADRGLALPTPALDKLLLAVACEYLAAADTLHRRANGDRGADQHLDRLEEHRPVLAPAQQGHAADADVGDKGSVVGGRGRKAGKVPTVTAVEAYAADRGVTRATLLRWQPVMIELNTQPWRRADWDAQVWTDSLVTAQRGQGTVKRTWLAAAKSVFRWAKSKKKVAANPFLDVTVSVPKKVVSRETGRWFTDTEAKTILAAAH